MDIAAILTRKYTGAEWTLDGDSYDGLTWLSDSPKPSEDELVKTWPEVKKQIETEFQAVEDARVSAINKLKKLGLTVEEVSAAFGLTV